MRDVFIGPRGLRAGWRVLLFIVTLIVCAIVVGVILKFALPHPPASHDRMMWPGGVMIGEGAAVAILLLTLVILAALDRTTIGTYGLPARGRGALRFSTGAVWGFGGLTLLLLLMHALHGYTLGAITGSPAFEARFGLEWAAAFLLVGFAEEVTMRSYLLFSLARGVGFWFAAVITSALFALMHVHNAGETPLGIGAVFVVGMLLCLFVRRTGDLWFPIGFHFAWDWAESFFYGVPDSGTISGGTLFHPSFSGATWISGGSAGPEGSALCYVVIAMMAVVFHFAYPRAEYRYEQTFDGVFERAARVQEIASGGTAKVEAGPPAQ
jgi:membrane protease YdiL (CAAX protease family)